jgi:hypothetical protein
MTIWIESWYKSDGTLDNEIHFYKITTNAINLLVMAGDNYSSTKLSAGKAIFDAKANLSEKINGVYTGIEGNSPLHVTMTDPDPSVDVDNETIGVTYFNNAGGIWFSSNYSLTGNIITEEQTLDSGTDNYITVKTTSTTTTSTPPPGKKTASIVDPTITESRFETWPNPFTEKVNFNFTSPSDTRARLEIYSITGAKLATLFDADIQAGRRYEAEYVPNLVSSQMVIYRLTMNGETRVGKLVYQERR